MLQVGDLGKDPSRPEWGPGKVREISGNNLTVYFRDIRENAVGTNRMDIVELEPAPAESDPFLDNVPPFFTYKLRPVRMKLTLTDGLVTFR